MANLVRLVLVAFTGFFSFLFGRDLLKAQKEGNLGNESVPKAAIVGFVTDFFDTLGIGSFAPTVAISKALKLEIPDKKIPGTLNVSHTIPVVIEALIFITVVEVEPVTLVSLLAAATIGSYVGAGIISKLDEKKIQLIMGIALALTAVIMFLSHPWINLFPMGGESTGLSGIRLIVGIIGNFVLGALMTAGVGLYAPCMALVYFLGMSPRVAFPIMMGSCAMLMPVASTKFIKEQAYAKKPSLVITIFGTIGVFVAAFLVTGMPMDVLKMLVVFVIAYTSFTMLKPALSKKENKELEV
jgi:uncharacterized membrane protein YfcA